MLGIVPQSHLNVLTFSVEDGEITEQVMLDYGSKILSLMLINVLCRVIVSVIQLNFPFIAVSPTG